MTVPSYDELTPSIPDVIDSERADNVASLLRAAVPAKTPARAAAPAVPVSGAYACIRLATSGALDAVLAVARDFSPRVRRASDSEVLLDVSGLGRLIGPPAEIERQLARALADAQVAASVATAPTQTIARLLARAQTTADGHTADGHTADGHTADRHTADGHTLRHKDHEDHKDHHHQRRDLCELCDLCVGACSRGRRRRGRRGAWQQLPVTFLRELEVLPPGMNHRDRARPYETLERWGMTTLAQVAALPSDGLASRLGRRGVALQRLARGLDPVPFVPDADVPRFIGRLELEWPIDALEPLSFVLARLLEPLSSALERADRGAAALRLELRLTDRSTHTRLLQLPAAMRDARVLRTLLLLDLESTPPPAAIDVVSIELDPAPARVTQFSLLQRALPSPETLSTLVARLSALAGESRVGAPSLVDSHAPDAFTMARYALSGPPSPLRGYGPPSPLRGYGPPSPLRGYGETAVPEMWSTAVLRRQRPPVALCVGVEHGRPVHLAASRRGVPYGAVVQAAGPWRTSGQWWSASTAGLAEARAEMVTREGGGWGLGNGAGWDRDEWDVALKSGAVCRIYLERSTERWFMDGVYD